MSLSRRLRFDLRRPLRFDPYAFVFGFLLIAGMYAAFLFLLWLAFGDPGGGFD